MFEKTEKKLESLDNDVVSIEAKMKEYTEKLRLKKEIREETMKSATVELLRENNISLNDLKGILSSVIDKTTTAEPKRKITVKATDEVIVETNEEPIIYGKETQNEQEID